MNLVVRALETLFRHKLLVLFPLFLIPILVVPVSILTAPVYYETWVSLWVQRPIYLRYADSTNPYITPAQAHTSQLAEMLKTRKFLGTVASKTVLAPLVGTPNGEERIQSYLAVNLSTFASGDHLISLRVHAETAQLSYQLANAVVQSYIDEVSNSQLNQTSVATGFYQSQLQQAQDQLSKSTAALRRYLAANPQLAQSTVASGGDTPKAAILDPQLATLQQQVDLDQKQVDTARGNLDQANLETSAALQGSDVGLQVIDPARVPTQPLRDVRKRAIVSTAASIAGGLVVGAAILVLLMFVDRSVRSELELLHMTQTNVLGALPKMTVRRTSANRRAGPDLTRRAIGFVAGSALPPPTVGGPKPA